MEITRLLISDPGSMLAFPSAVMTVGLVIGDGRVFWGECLINPTRGDQKPTIQRLVDLCEQRLRGEHAADFRELCQLILPIFPPPGKLVLADRVKGAIQQAMLGAVSAFQARSAVEILATAYNLPEWKGIRDTPLIFLEADDHSATAEIYDRFLAGNPAGVGYRINGERASDSIGEKAEYLQEFVRDLSKRSDQLAVSAERKPAIYLALNGAFGRLARDPIIHLGKILEFCHVMHEAAGVHRVLLEEPFLIEDSLAQPANMRRLKDHLYRTVNSGLVENAVILVQRAGSIPAEELPIYVDTEAVHGIIFEPLLTTDIDSEMTRMVTFIAGNIDVYVSLRTFEGVLPTPRWIETAVELAFAQRAKGMILNIHPDHKYVAGHAAKHVAELSALIASR